MENVKKVVLVEPVAMVDFGGLIGGKTADYGNRFGKSNLELKSGMSYCTICNQVIEVAVDDAAGQLLHRYFQHGSVAERLARWGISLAAAIFVPKLVQEVRRELA